MAFLTSQAPLPHMLAALLLTLGAAAVPHRHVADTLLPSRGVAGAPFWSRTPVPQSITHALLAANATSSLGVAITFNNAASTPLWGSQQYQLASERRLTSFLNRLVVVAWDDRAHAACQAKQHVRCARDPNLLDEELRSEGGAEALGTEVGYHDTNVRHHLYARMCWRRVEVVAHALSLGLSTMLVDADVLVFADPSVAFGRHTEEMRAVMWGGGEKYSAECPRPGCPKVAASINGGVYLAQPTEGVRAVFRRMLESSRHLDRDTFEQDTYADELASAEASGEVTGVIVEPALIQGDCKGVDDYCRASKNVPRCSICDKVAIHASACGGFAEKDEHMTNFREAYAKACGGAGGHRPAGLG